MYRDDQEAAIQRAESATREADDLRRENDAMRNALVAQAPAPPTFAFMPNNAVYPNLDPRMLPLSERARLSQHSLQRSSVVGGIFLNWITFGLYGLIHFGAMHDRMPRAAANDPSAGKAIGFQFIPYFNFYWIFFNALRLCDRVNLQFRLRGLPNRAPRGLVLTACIFTVIPYIGWLLAYLIFWPIAGGKLQVAVNEAAALPTHHFDATLVHGTPYGAPAPYGLAAPPPPNWR
jgi:hypothetical protein